MAASKPKHHWHRETLEQATSHALEEARMVLPGVQALFGFQLMVVFNDTFATKLSYGEQLLHFVALGFVAIAILLVIAPAAYHRQAEPERSSRTFVSFSSVCLAAAMLVLAIATCLELYLVGVVIIDSETWSFVIAGTLFAAFFTAWFVVPRLRPLE